MTRLREIIERAWDDRSLLDSEETRESINQVVELLDKGEIRVAEPQENGEWLVNEWIKKAVILYFPLQEMKTIEVGPFEFNDKIPLKKDYASLGVRVVPQ